MKMKDQDLFKIDILINFIKKERKFLKNIKYSFEYFSILNIIKSNFFKLLIDKTEIIILSSLIYILIVISSNIYMIFKLFKF